MSGAEWLEGVLNRDPSSFDPHAGSKSGRQSLSETVSTVARPLVSKRVGLVRLDKTAQLFVDQLFDGAARRHLPEGSECRHGGRHGGQEARWQGSQGRVQAL